MDFVDLKAYGLDVDAGFSYTGGEVQYCAALQRFYKGYEPNTTQFNSYLEENSIEDLTILVHAIKGNALMIGATRLSSVAQELEQTGKSGNMDLFRAGSKEFLDLYKDVIEHLKPYGTMDKINIPGVMTEEEVKERLDSLAQALRDCADDEAISLTQELTAYPFRISQKQKLNEVRDDIDNFMYDEALEIVENIRKALY